MIRFSTKPVNNGDKALWVGYSCDECNGHEDITSLVQELVKWGVNDCPSKLYMAWKVLVLGTREYRSGNNSPHKEHIIVRGAINNIKSGKA